MDSDECNNQLERDLRTAMTFSLFEIHGTSGHKDGAGASQFKVAESPLDVPICQGNKLNSGLGNNYSDIEEHNLSPSHIPKINSILPSLSFDVEINLDNLSSSESEGMSPCSTTLPVVAAHILKRPLYEYSSTAMAAKRPKIHTVRRSSANSNASQTSSQGSSVGEDYKRRKRNLQNDVHYCGFHITRRQSRELSRILHGTPRDKGSIRHRLDPSIFDAEVSDNDSESDIELLPEEKEELEYILEPRCLDMTYNEDIEFHSDDSDNLPDLDQFDSEVEDSKPEVYTCEAGFKPGKQNMCNVTPVLDKLKMVAQVKLKRIEDYRPHIKKRLKLKSASEDSDTETCKSDLFSSPRHSLTQSPQKMCSSPMFSPISPPHSTSNVSSLPHFVWNQKHNSKLKSIVSKVKQDLSAAKYSSSTEGSDVDMKGSLLDVDVAPLLPSAGDSVPDEAGEEADIPIDLVSPRPVKLWYMESDVSNSEEDLDSEEEEERLRRHKEAAATHKGQGRVVSALPQKRCKRTPPITLCSRLLLHLEHSIHGMLKADSKAEMCHPLNIYMVDMIENSDIDDENFQLRYLKICRSYISGLIDWPEHILKQLMHLLLEGDSIQVTRSAYEILNSILTINSPKCLPFDWDKIEYVVNRLKLLNGVSYYKVNEIFGAALALQYMVSALEVELQYSAGKASRDAHLSHRHLTKSKAFKWLSVDCGFHGMRQVIDWLLNSLSFGQHVPSLFTHPAVSFTPTHRHLPHRDDKTSQVAKDYTTSLDVPKVLPLFQRLLNLGVVVSQRHDNNIHRIVNKLVLGYIHMPLYFHRQLLISTVKSPLLTFKLCQQVLEDYGSSNINYGLNSMSFSLEDLLLTYSSFVPPTTDLTPPLTPTHQEDDDKEQPPSSNDIRKYSPANVEELAFLMWSLVSNYVKVNDTEQVQRTLQDMTIHVRVLEASYRSLTTEITAKTKLYLQMMESLSSAQLF